jgi:hypothetical protein
LAKRQPIAASRVVRDPCFVLNGGNGLEIELSGHHDREVVDYMKMQVRFSVESVIHPRGVPAFSLCGKIPDLAVVEQLDYILGGF